MRGIIKDKKGFTLAEIMIVILVIAVMVAVLVPALGGAVRKAQISAALQNGKRAYEAAQILATEAYVQFGSANVDVDFDDINTYLGKAGFFTAENLEIAAEAGEGGVEGGTITGFKYKHTDDIIVVLNKNGEIVLQDDSSLEE